MESDPLLTVKEVAERLRLNPRTILRWLDQGKLHGVWLGSDRAGWRIRSSEVDLLLQGGQQTQQLRLPPEPAPKGGAAVAA